MASSSTDKRSVSQSDITYLENKQLKYQVKVLKEQLKRYKCLLNSEEKKSHRLNDRVQQLESILGIQSHKIVNTKVKNAEDGNTEDENAEGYLARGQNVKLEDLTELKAIVRPNVNGAHGSCVNDRPLSQFMVQRVTQKVNEQRRLIEQLKRFVMSEKSLDENVLMSRSTKCQNKTLIDSKQQEKRRAKANCLPDLLQDEIQPLTTSQPYTSTQSLPQPSTSKQTETDQSETTSKVNESNAESYDLQINSLQCETCDNRPINNACLLRGRPECTGAKRKKSPASPNQTTRTDKYAKNSQWDSTRDKTSMTLSSIESENLTGVRICPCCNKNFTKDNQEQFEQHVNECIELENQTEKQEDEHVCPLCGLKESGVARLEIHVLKHFDAADMQFEEIHKKDVEAVEQIFV